MDYAKDREARKRLQDALRAVRRLREELERAEDELWLAHENYRGYPNV